MSRHSPLSNELCSRVCDNVVPRSLLGLIRHNCSPSCKVLRALIILEGIVLTVSIFHYCNSFMTHFLQ